jgi:putative DNA primase/helicase
MSDYDLLGPTGPRLMLCRGSDIKIEPISWIWPTWLAAGKLHMLGGVPGTGKTTIALYLAATVTRGARWPDGTQCLTTGNVLIWSGEDDAADTLMPRLTAMGADRERVYVVSDMQEAHGKRPFDPARDMPALIAAARRTGNIKLLIVDPVVTAVSGDSHKNAEVRRGLAPLVVFAQELGAAVIGITHFTKGTAGKDPLDRLTGSLAFGAAPRLVFAAAKARPGTIAHSAASVFIRVKSNIGPGGGAFTYTLTKAELPGGIETSRVEWGSALEGDAHTILANVEGQQGSDGGTAVEEAEQFLLETLVGGPLDAAVVIQQAQEANIAEKTLRRAKKALGIIATKCGMSAGWDWRLPKTANPTENGHTETWPPSGIGPDSTMAS